MSVLKVAASAPAACIQMGNIGAAVQVATVAPEAKA